MMAKIMRSLGCGAAVVVAGLALVADVAQAQSSTFAVPPGVTISAGGVSVDVSGSVCCCWC